MRIRSLPSLVGLASLAIVGGGQSFAEASCIRQVTNRSVLTLVVSQEGGPAVTVRPGTSRTIRLDGPRPVEVAAYCGIGPRGEVPAGPPAIQRSFAVTAVQDRCFYEIGIGFFERELGVGFLPRFGTEPFALNAPRQGDLALGPAVAVCPGLR